MSVLKPPQNRAILALAPNKTHLPPGVFSQAKLIPGSPPPPRRTLADLTLAGPNRSQGLLQRLESGGVFGAIFF